jgi:hypothetical protein
MELLAIKSEGNMKDLQYIQVLVPPRYPSLNLNVYGLRRCFRVGYSDEQLPFEERKSPDIWDINSVKD